GAALGDRKRGAEADAAFRKAIDILGQIDTVDARLERERTRLNLTLMLAATGDADRAVAELRTVRGNLSKLAAGDPDDQRYAAELARAAGVGGQALWQVGRAEAAEDAFRDSADRFAELSAKYPERLAYKFEWAKRRRNLALLLGDMKKPAE